MRKTKASFGIAKKLVLFVGALALVTYTTSFVFIEYIQPTFFPKINIIVFEIITFSLGIIWSCILAAVFSGVLVRPLQDLEEVTMQAAEGNIHTDVKLPRTNDEIQIVAKAFSLMLENLRDIVHTIDSNFKKTNDTVSKLTAQASSATTSAENISNTIRHISTGAETSALAVQDTAEAMEDARNSATTVNTYANNSAKQANELVQNLSVTTKVIANLAKSIEKIAANSEQTLQQVQTLNDNAKQVEGIVSLVGSISEQTNLLALNASIEAARAGEHGKGFAVVADEVRALADESAGAVKDIAELIHTMQANVTEAVQQMATQVSFATSEAAKVSDTTAQVDAMSVEIKTMAEATVQISQLMAQQMQAIELMAKQSQEVAAIAEETSAGAEEVRATAEVQMHSISEIEDLTKELTEQSQQLHATIKRFH